MTLSIGSARGSSFIELPKQILNTRSTIVALHIPTHIPQ
jgi:hypothetical protein